MAAESVGIMPDNSIEEVKLVDTLKNKINDVVDTETDVVDDDKFLFYDSTDSGKKKKIAWSGIVTKLTNFFSGLFAPITFATNFYMERTGLNTANLVNTPPVASAANYMEVANTTNTTINWDGTQKLVISRVLQAPLTLNPNNSFLFDMVFAISGDSILEFGARSFIDGVQIASNQVFGSIEVQGAGTYGIVNYYNATIKIDMLTGATTYPAGSVITTEVFKRQDSVVARTIRYFCGVTVNSEYRNSIITTNTNSVVINTSNIMDGSVTKQKLSSEVQTLLDTSSVTVDDATIQKINDVISVKDLGIAKSKLTQAFQDELNAMGGNPLSGKTILFIGDSICEGIGADTDGTGIKKPYSYWIQQLNEGATIINMGQGGLSVAQPATPSGSGTNTLYYRINNGDFTSLIDNVDYIIIEGGVNDQMGTQGIIQLGNITPMQDSPLNVNSFCGGLEYAFRYFKTNFPTTKIGFISTYNRPTTDKSYYSWQKIWWHASAEICAKYAVQYLDIFSLYNPNVYGEASDYYTQLHANYMIHRDLIAPPINDWLKSFCNPAYDSAYCYKPKFASRIFLSSGTVSFTVGTAFSTSDWVVKTIGSDGYLYTTVTPDIVSGNVNTGAPGTYPVSVGFKGDNFYLFTQVNVTYTGVATKTLSSISATKTDTSYVVGETLLTNDIVTTATYSDSTTATVTPSEINVSAFHVDGEGKLDTPGTNNIVITYVEGGITKTTTIPVTVSAVAKVLDSITAVKADQSYTIGETLVTSDITVTAHYTDLTTATVTPSTPDISGVPNNSGVLTTAGTYDIGLSYTEGGVTKTTAVSVTVAASSVIASGNFNDGGNQPTGSWVLGTDGKLTITTSSASNVGMNSTWTATTMPWYAYRLQILSVEYVGKWTNSGNNALVGATNLTTVVLATTITAISTATFQDCSSLTTINLANITSVGIYGMRNTGLTTLTLGATSLSDGAFRSCSALTQVTFTGTPSSIHANAFQYDTNITSIRVPWASGAVANAPWGATAATITYNYVG